jgi:hypothetical protein
MYTKNDILHIGHAILIDNDAALFVKKTTSFFSRTRAITNPIEVITLDGISEIEFVSQNNFYDMNMDLTG